MGISVVLQRMWNHRDSYRERLQTMLRGMASQGLGHASGPHSSFIPYHVDAITLQAVGDGWQDEMAMGRCVESTFRSLNNLLEKFHQSFFFYLLMQANRFVSIGTYLPSAMLVAVNFTIMAIALWIRSGRSAAPNAGLTKGKDDKKPDMEVIEHDGMVAVVPKQSLTIVERQLFLPIALVVASHFLGIIPLYIFNNTTQDVSPTLSLANYQLLTFAGSLSYAQPVCSGKLHVAQSLSNPDFPPDSANSTTTPAAAVLLTPPTRNVPRHSGHVKLLARLPHWIARCSLVFRRATLLDYVFRALRFWRQGAQDLHDCVAASDVTSGRDASYLQGLGSQCGRCSCRGGFWVEGPWTVDPGCRLVHLVAAVACGRCGL